MRIYNIHERAFELSPDVVGTAIDNLAGPNDFLWPSDRWPAMKFDSALSVGAVGGHGPIRYFVTEYIPGRRVTFQFDDKGMAAGLDGRHFFEVVQRPGHVILRHVVDANCRLKHWLFWQLVLGRLHDACVEDALDRAENTLISGASKRTNWSPWVRLLYWIISRSGPGG